MSEEKAHLSRQLKGMNIKCTNSKRELPRNLFKINRSICSDCLAIEPPQEEFDTIGRFVMHKSLYEFPVLVEALEIVSFFLDSILFENCVHYFLCQIALSPLNRYSDRIVRLSFLSLWTENDHRFVKDVPSQEQFSIDDDLEEEELESYKFAPNCLRRSS
jgi:hypothetical protein